MVSPRLRRQTAPLSELSKPSPAGASRGWLLSVPPLRCLWAAAQRPEDEANFAWQHRAAPALEPLLGQSCEQTDRPSQLSREHGGCREWPRAQLSYMPCRLHRSTLPTATRSRPPPFCLHLPQGTTSPLGARPGWVPTSLIQSEALPGSSPCRSASRAGENREKVTRETSRRGAA